MTLLSVWHIDAIDVRLRGRHALQASRTAMASAVPSRVNWPVGRSTFEGPAVLACGLPSKVGHLSGILLTSTFPMSASGSQVLNPLWAEEAMHRAYCLMSLVDAQNCRRNSTNRNPVVAVPDIAVAYDLVDRFRSLETGGERDLLFCSTIMRDVIIGFGTLFGRPLGVTIEAEIEEVLLPAYKRRALVLAVAELISNALLRAFSARRAGAIEVELTAKMAMSARLRVADCGVGFTGAPPNLDCGVAAGLANLLEADLSYDRKDGWTIAEIVFPLSGP